MTDSAISKLLLSYGRYIVQSMRPENFGKDEQFLSEQEAADQLYKLMVEVIGHDEPGITNVMIVMEHARQFKKLDRLFGRKEG